MFTVLCRLRDDVRAPRDDVYLANVRADRASSPRPSASRSSSRPSRSCGRCSASAGSRRSRRFGSSPRYGLVKAISATSGEVLKAFGKPGRRSRSAVLETVLLVPLVVALTLWLELPGAALGMLARGVDRGRARARRRRSGRSRPAGASCSAALAPALVPPRSSRDALLALAVGAARASSWRGRAAYAAGAALFARDVAAARLGGAAPPARERSASHRPRRAPRPPRREPARASRSTSSGARARAGTRSSSSRSRGRASATCCPGSPSTTSRRAAVRGRLGLAREIASFARAAARMLERERARFDVVYTRMPATWVSDVLYLPGLVDGEIDALPSRDAEPGGPSRRAKDALQPLVRPAIPVRRRLERRRSPGRARARAGLHGARSRASSSGVRDPRRARARPPARRLARRASRRATAPAARAELGLAGRRPARPLLRPRLRAQGARPRHPRRSRACGSRARLVVVGRDDPRPGRAWRGGRRRRPRPLRGRAGRPGAPYYRAADVRRLPLAGRRLGRADRRGDGGRPARWSRATAAGACEAARRRGDGLRPPGRRSTRPQLAATLDALAANPERRARIGAAAREAAHGRSAGPSTRRRLEDALRSAAAARSGASSRTTTVKSAVGASGRPAAPSAANGAAREARAT